MGFREWDERGVEMHSPLYGQADAGTIRESHIRRFATSRKQYMDVGTSETHEAQINTVGAALAPVAGTMPPPPPPPLAASLDPELFHRAMREENAVAASTVDDDGLDIERCSYDPCIYAKKVVDGGCVVNALYVDDGACPTTAMTLVLKRAKA